MRRVSALGFVLSLIAAFSQHGTGQQGSIHESTVPLALTGAVPLSNVRGRIDHFGIDPTHNRLFVSALGNNTVEIIDISAQAVIHSLSGVPTPQGVVYSSETNKLFVGSDEGKLYIYDGSTFDLITSIDFGDDVDNLRYDATEKRVGQRNLHDPRLSRSHGNRSHGHRRPRRHNRNLFDGYRRALARLSI